MCGFLLKKHKKKRKIWKPANKKSDIVKNTTKLLKNDCAECNKTLCIFCAKNQLDLKTTLVVIVVADEQVKKITNTFKPLKKVKGEKGHE